MLKSPIVYLVHGRPEKDTEENTHYNYYVLKVQICSEHCIGFLKGRWSSLRGLRIYINDKRGLHYAILWITACILLHVLLSIMKAQPSLYETDSSMRA
ncbi:hypothetical protein BJV74DRAFT_784654 [Russula compacta]|nr:hypothetical protein BJV74DRAFT_784654 [Russula compacta]